MHLTRRHFLRDSQLGIGAMALSSLLARDGVAAPQAAVNPLAPRQPHFPAKAKQVIYLHMTGSPPNLDLWDYKPELVKRTGEYCPDSFLKGRTFAFTTGVPKLLGTPRKFEQYGQGQQWMSDAVPHLHEHADEMCMVHSMYTEQFNHAPAELLLYTGSPRSGRPAMGAWVTYGLGSENENLPGYVVLISSGVQPNGGANSFGSGFLPSVFQGVQCRSKGDPVLYASDPPGMDRDLRRKSLDALRDLNELQAAELGHPETATRIAQYELAYRMQTAVPELTDVSKEPKQVFELYGPEARTPGTFAANCLLARRLAERGVRFIQLFHRGWDQHTNLPKQIVGQCRDTDQPSAALIHDLKQRGLLDDTLVVWGGEFGRTVYCQGKLTADDYGRDHHPRCFTLWLSGGGVKGGIMHGETDDFSYNITRDPVHVHDLHATILHCLGIDHTRLTFKFQGRHHRLTDVHGSVVKEILV
jgi:Protein of unknown function (DUF1501)